MKKYFFTILLFLSLSKGDVFADVLLLTPSNGSVLESTVVDFEWVNTNSEVEYIYRFETSGDPMFSLSMFTPNLLQTTIRRGFTNRSIYFWRVRYHPRDTFEGKYEFVSEIFVFGINREIPQDVLNQFVKKEEQEEEVENEDVIEENILEEEQSEEKISREQKEEVEYELPFLDYNYSFEKSVLGKQKKDIEENFLEEFAWNVQSSKSVLGTTSSKENVVCKFKYNRKSKEIEKIFCNIPKPLLNEQKRYIVGNEYSLVVVGDVQDSFSIQIDEYDCNVEILRPSTWFKCEERYVKSNILQISPNILFQVYKGDILIPVLSYARNGKSFYLIAGHSRNTENIVLKYRCRILSGQYDLFYEESNIYPLSLSDYGYIDGSKPFSFPFNKIVGVTQWYGYTQYQSPHSGIDFGAYRENILAVGDGEVVSKGWDSYFGECLSGGNFLKVKQSNGMYTVYFHLEDMFVNTGDFVKRGDVIGRSGNSGAWNCQRLAYHLHFETRLNSSMGSHSNPVKYIDADWNSILTLGYATYPGRLSGENPHPGR